MCVGSFGVDIFLCASDDCCGDADIVGCCCEVSSEPEEVIFFASLCEGWGEFFDEGFGLGFGNCEGEEDCEGLCGLGCEVGEVCCEDFLSVGLWC